MTAVDHQKDLILAQEICDELLSGNSESILKIYHRYHPFFLAYTRKRLYSIDPDRALSILDDFWVELLNARAICDFKGFASLKNYLFRILNYRIVDNVRRANRQGAYSKNVSDKDHEIDGFGSEEESPEKDIMHKQKIELIHESLLMLTENSPSDAYLVKMHLERLEYRQMAENLLQGQTYTAKQLNRKVNAIK